MMKRRDSCPGTQTVQPGHPWTERGSGGSREVAVLYVDATNLQPASYDLSVQYEWSQPRKVRL